MAQISIHIRSGHFLARTNHYKRNIAKGPCIFHFQRFRGRIAVDLVANMARISSQTRNLLHSSYTIHHSRSTELDRRIFRSRRVHFRNLVGRPVDTVQISTHIRRRLVID